MKRAGMIISELVGAGETAEDVNLELSSPDYPKMDGILKLPCLALRSQNGAQSMPRYGSD